MDCLAFLESFQEHNWHNQNERCSYYIFTKLPRRTETVQKGKNKKKP
jgi:hypothetical protein